MTQKEKLYQKILVCDPQTIEQIKEAAEKLGNTTIIKLMPAQQAQISRNLAKIIADWAISKV